MGKSVGTSPAMKQYQDAINQQVAFSMNKLAPLQKYFADQVTQQRQARDLSEGGMAAATARAEAQDQQKQQLTADTVRGARAGSGKYLTDMQSGTNTSGAYGALGQTAGGLSGEQTYVRGLQQILGMSAQDKQQALSGLGTAAGQEQQVEQAKAQAHGQVLGAIGSLVGTGVGLAAGGPLGGVVGGKVGGTLGGLS